MKEILCNSAYFGVTVSLIGYGAGIMLKKKFKYAFLNPLLISIIFVIGVVMLCGVDYESYENSAQYLSYLLTPATVACGILAGVLASLGSVLLLAFLFGLEHDVYVTLLPKSITTAIGMGVSEELGGLVTITVAVIIVTGVIGNVIGEAVCKLFRIYEPIAKGLALGTSSHAIGTAKALEMGEVEGAMSSLAIAVAGLLTVIGASVFAGFY